MSSAFLDWTALTTIEAQTLDPDMSLVVLPMAAIEQHGPHLPLGDRSLINEGILDAVAPVSGLDVDIYRLPALTIGKSDEHQVLPRHAQPIVRHTGQHRDRDGGRSRPVRCPEAPDLQ